MSNRQVVLKRHPNGIPVPEDFDLVEGSIAEPGDGQMLAVDKLESNGILAININNTKDHNIIDKLIEDVKNLEIMEFLGIIYFGNPKCKTTIYQPILIWKIIY